MFVAAPPDPVTRRDNSFEQENVLSNIHNGDVHGSKYDKTPQRLDGFIPDLQMIDIILHNRQKKWI